MTTTRKKVLAEVPQMVTMSIAQYRTLIAAEKKQSKYNAKKVQADGYTFDSKAEYEYYIMTLKPLAQAGAIKKLEVHPRYKLVVNNQFICTYIADFRYIDQAGKTHVVDVKGVRTDVFMLKKKLMAACLGIEVEEIPVRARKKR